MDNNRPGCSKDYSYMQSKMEVENDQNGQDNMFPPDQLAMPPPPPPTLNANASTQQIEVGFSEDPSHHITGCSFLRWIINQKSLLTSGDVYAGLLDFQIRTKGKNKLAPIMDKVKEETAAKVAGPMVQGYLAGSKAAYDRNKALYISLCRCPRARSGVASTAAAASENVNVNSATVFAAPRASVPGIPTTVFEAPAASVPVTSETVFAAPVASVPMAHGTVPLTVVAPSVTAAIPTGNPTLAAASPLCPSMFYLHDELQNLGLDLSGSESD